MRGTKPGLSNVASKKPSAVSGQEGAAWLSADGEASARNSVAKLMRQAAADLAEQTQPLGLPNGVLKLRESLGHLVDELAEVAQLIITRRAYPFEKISEHSYPGISARTTPAEFVAVINAQRRFRR